jgi:hypothetical protein
MRPSLRNDSDIKVNLIDDLLKQEYMLGEFVYNKDLRKKPFLVYFPSCRSVTSHCISWQEKKRFRILLKQLLLHEQNVFLSPVTKLRAIYL